MEDWQLDFCRSPISVLLPITFSGSHVRPTKYDVCSMKECSFRPRSLLACRRARICFQGTAAKRRPRTYISPDTILPMTKTNHRLRCSYPRNHPNCNELVGGRMGPFSTLISTPARTRYPRRSPEIGRRCSATLTSTKEPHRDCSVSN